MKGLYVIRYKNSIEYLDKHNKNHIIERSTEKPTFGSQYKLYYGSIPSEVNKTYCKDEIHSVLDDKEEKAREDFFKLFSKNFHALWN